MRVRYTRRLLHQLEHTFKAADYKLRYERGQFLSAPCKLHAVRVLVINKYLSLESKIELLISLLQTHGITPPKGLEISSAVKKR